MSQEHREQGVSSQLVNYKERIGFDFSDETLELAESLLEDIKSVENYSNYFASRGGTSVAPAVALSLACDRTGVALPAERFVAELREMGSVTRDLDVDRFRALRQKFHRELDLDYVEVGAEDWVNTWWDELDSFSQKSICKCFGMSDVALRDAYKSVVDRLTELDSEGKVLDDPGFCVESFGFDGDTEKGFALFLAENGFPRGTGRSPSVRAAASVYIAGQTNA